MPLFFVGLAAFAISYLAIHFAEGIGSSRLPLWALFAATGTVVLGGGFAVIFAGGEEVEIPFDPDSTVVLARDEYERLLRASERPESWREVLPAALAESPPTFSASPAESVSLPPDPRRIPPVVVSGPATAERTLAPAEAPPASRPRTLGTASPVANPPSAALELPAGNPPRAVPDVEARIREMTAALDSLVAPLSPPSKRPDPVPATRPSPERTGSKSTRDPVSSSGGVRDLSALSSPATVENASTPSLMGPPPRRPPVRSSRSACTTCGSRIEDARMAPRCQVCEESLCPNCRLRAEWDHHPDLCARCFGLLSLAESGEEQ